MYRIACTMHHVLCTLLAVQFMKEREKQLDDQAAYEALGEEMSYKQVRPMHAHAMRGTVDAMLVMWVKASRSHGKSCVPCGDACAWHAGTI